MKTETPYDEGLACADRGGSAAECPYEYESKDGQDWLDGYHDGGGED